MPANTIFNSPDEENFILTDSQGGRGVGRYLLLKGLYWKAAVDVVEGLFGPISITPTPIGCQANVLITQCHPFSPGITNGVGGMVAANQLCHGLVNKPNLAEKLNTLARMLLHGISLARS